MAYKLGLGILLMCLVQAELVCCSWTKDALRSKYGNPRAGFPLPDGRSVKVRNLQNQMGQGFSPRSVQSSSFKTSPGVNSPYSQRLSTSGKNPRSFPEMGKKESLAAPQGEGGPKRASYSFRSVELETSRSGQKSSATLFNKVGPGPRGSIRMQTHAQGPARKVSSRRTASGPKARSFSPQTVAGRSHLKPQFALNVEGYRSWGQLQPKRLAGPRSSRGGESALGFAPVIIHEIPESFGGSAIRRLKKPTEQVKLPTQKPQPIYTPPKRVPHYKSDPNNIQPGSPWIWTKQNQRPVQKPLQIPTQPPPKWVPAYNPDPPKAHPASTWAKVKRPYRL